MPTAKILRVLFVAYVAATLVHIGWCVAHEPFTFDAWNMASDTRAKPFSVGNFFEYWRFEYTHSNPRFGQAFAYLAYKLEYFAVIGTPLAYFAISLAVTTLGLARFPFKRGKDLALWAFVLGAMWFALPHLPMEMFCRAYCTNYIYTAAIQLWFLVPLRLVPDGRSSNGAAAAYALAGFVAGMGNEHTGPTIALFLVIYAYLLAPPRPNLVWAGAIGFIAGFAAIFFAPGQGERYDGLAQKTGMVGRLLQRGILGNLDILRDLLLGAAPILLAIVLVLLFTRRTRDELRAPLRFLAVAFAGATLMAMTIFVSPKLGPRFYIFSCCLILAGFVALVDRAISSRRALAGIVVIAVFASGYAVARTVPLYSRAFAASQARLAALEAAPAASVVVTDAFDQLEDSWWFLGDDFRDTKKREMVADYFALSGVVLRSYEMTAPLGVSTARFVALSTVEPPITGDTGIGLGSFKGFDLPGIHREAKIGIELLRERLGPSHRLQAVDLLVSLDDPKLVLPRRRILVARWRPDSFEAYAGQATRAGNKRELVLPKDLAGRDDEIFMYQVGGEAKRLGTARDAHLSYVPWKAGVYWALACRSDECFVFYATHHGA